MEDVQQFQKIVVCLMLDALVVLMENVQDVKEIGNLAVLEQDVSL
jgi:hypothetical protein